MPQLTPVVESLDGVPEALRTYYVEKEGKFHVDLSAAPAGYAPSADLATANGKVVEFRENNISLTREVEELRPLKDLKTKFEGIDPTAARTAIAAQAALGDKGINKPSDLDTTIATAVAAAVDKIRKDEIDPLKTQITTVTAERTTERDRTNELLMKDAIGTKFLDSNVGGEPGAIDFILSKAKGVFVIENGVVKAAPNQFSAVNPAEPLGIDEWMEQQTKASPFAFKTSQGGGVPPSKKGAKPGQVILRDPTPLQLGDPVIAKQLKEGKLKIEYTQQTV